MSRQFTSLAATAIVMTSLSTALFGFTGNRCRRDRWWSSRCGGRSSRGRRVQGQQLAQRALLQARQVPPAVAHQVHQAVARQAVVQRAERRQPLVRQAAERAQARQRELAWEWQAGCPKARSTTSMPLLQTSPQQPVPPARSQLPTVRKRPSDGGSAAIDASPASRRRWTVLRLASTRRQRRRLAQPAWRCQVAVAVAVPPQEQPCRSARQPSPRDRAAVAPAPLRRCRRRAHRQQL